MKRMKYVTSCFLLVSLNFFPSTYSVETGKCDHDEISDNVINLISCLDNVINDHVEDLITEYKKQVKENSKNYNVKKVKDSLVKIYDDATACVVDFSSKCLEEKHTNLVKLFIEEIRPILQEVTEDAVKQSLKLEKFLKEWETVVGDSYSETMTFLEGLWSTDKKCNIEKIEDTINKEIIQPCFKLQIETLVPLYYYVQGSTREYYDKDCQYDQNNPNNCWKYKKRYESLPKTVSVCQVMDATVNSCMKETACISTREMTFLRTIGVKIYNMAMNKATKIKEQFESLAEMINTVKSTEFSYGDTGWDDSGEDILDSYIDLDNAFCDDEKQARLLETADYLFDDYKGENCMRKLAALVKELPGSKSNRTSIMNEILISTVLLISYILNAVIFDHQIV